MQTEAAPNSIKSFKGTYQFLSNFFPSKVVFDGVEYPSTEHAYQAAKTLDLEERAKVLNSKSFGAAKRMGTKITLREDWEQVKLAVMEDVLRQKFAVSELRELLDLTKGQELVEANHWHDNFWGSCFCNTCGSKGQNHLGRLLMLIRDSE